MVTWPYVSLNMETWKSAIQENLSDKEIFPIMTRLQSYKIEHQLNKFIGDE